MLFGAPRDFFPFWVGSVDPGESPNLQPWQPGFALILPREGMAKFLSDLRADRFPDTTGFASLSLQTGDPRSSPLGFVTSFTRGHWG